VALLAAGAINIGGSTGLQYFRPPLANLPADGRYEAKDILVEGNTFLGAGALPRETERAPDR
jgi:hypothetical protein